MRIDRFWELEPNNKWKLLMNDFELLIGSEKRCKFDIQGIKSYWNH